MEQEHKPRTSMILLLEHIHAMNELTNEEFGEFVRNYAQYVETGLEPAYDNDRAMRMLWKVVKAFDDMNVQKMEERDKRRREANKKNINKRWNDKKYESIPMVSQDTNGSLSVSDSVSDKKEKCEKKNANEAKRFKAPTVEQVKGYFADNGYTESEAERFADHFTANGWKVCKSPMKDWKAAARNWMRNVKDWNGGYQQTMAELPDEGDFLR